MRPVDQSLHGIAALPGTSPGPIRLTQLTECGGCAAKLGADLLEDALAGLVGAVQPPNLIAGLRPADDAAAYRVSPDLAIIGTLDFFPPLVDDPRTFGEIAAANALSDVFAMGGRVLFALSIAAVPEELPREALAAILDGAAGKVREAGGTLAGGHTIRDAEPKYGLAVVGAAHPDRLLRKGGAMPGDQLLLTKRLGTGLLVSGSRQGLVADSDLTIAIDQMRRLNRTAAEVLVAADIRGATDVTGFGLLGHALEMCRGSDLGAEIRFADVPLLGQVAELAQAPFRTGAATRNWDSYGAEVAFAGADWQRDLLCDPQTSGGLLIAVSPEAAGEALALVRSAGFADAAVVGEMTEGHPRIRIA
jgi:selenide,water dikinase